MAESICIVKVSLLEYVKIKVQHSVYKLLCSALLPTHTEMEIAGEVDL